MKPQSWPAVMTVSTWPSRIGNPGSTKAIRRGCACSPVLNYFGRGDDSGLFKIAPACKVHGSPSPLGGPVQCARCGADLEVIGVRVQRTFCPNGCTDAQIDHPTAAGTSDSSPADAVMRPALDDVEPENDRAADEEANLVAQGICPRCVKRIPAEKRRGRPRKFHEHCLTLRERERQARNKQARVVDAVRERSA